MTAPNSAIAVARPRGAYLAVTVACLGMAAAVVALVVSSSHRDFMSYAVLACAAVLTLGGISTLYSLVSKGPALLVSDEGIMDCTSLFGVGLVRWGEIAGLATFHFYAQRYFIILLKDPHAFAKRLGPLPRAVVTLNSVISPAPICIPSGMLPGIDELLMKIQQSYNDQLASHGIRIRQ